MPGEKHRKLKRSAKKAGADGDYIMHNGDYIFSNTEVVQGAAKHTRLYTLTGDAWHSCDRSCF